MIVQPTVIRAIVWVGSLGRLTKTWRESVESLVVKKVKLKEKALKQSRIGQRTKDDHESKWVKNVEH